MIGFAHTTPQKLDRLIFFASYEKRCLQVAREMSDSHVDNPVLVFYCADISSPERDDNLAEISGLFPGRVTQVPVSYKGPTKMIEFAGKLKWPGSTLVDVSCFNRANLFSFLWASRLGLGVEPELTLSYSEPESYGTWLTADYKRADNFIGFGGEVEFAANRHLICLLGLEGDRALEIINSVEPSSLTIVVGTTKPRAEQISRNRESFWRELGTMDHDIRIIDVKNPAACLVGLQEIVNELPKETSIHIAPLSTKPSCLAAYGLWLQNRAIRLWNAQPETYNLLDYSKGMKPGRYYRARWQ